MENQGIRSSGGSMSLFEKLDIFIFRMFIFLLFLKIKLYSWILLDEYDPLIFYTKLKIFELNPI